MRPLLVGTSAYNLHVQHIVGALADHGALVEYVTGGVDCFRGWLGGGRRIIRRWVPVADRELSRRAVVVPCDRIRTRWRWELPRVILSRTGARRVEDWWWERSEHALDRACAARVAQDAVGGFLGVEHGALAALRAARRLGKPGVLAFLSPHPRTLAAWVGEAYARAPELRTPHDAAVHALSGDRDRRRDEEARLADWILTNSSFTTRSLVDAGVPAGKILTVPLGGPAPIASAARVPTTSRGVRFAYVGPLSVRKGAHLLLRAWREVHRDGDELHCYGQCLLPPTVVREALAAPGGRAIILHGSIPASELPAAYQQASMLVFPTLCDGFGMVVSEAMANGLPVITTSNAGAADLVIDGVNGRVVSPGDVQALVEAMRWCQAAPGALDAMRPHALRTAAARTWAHFREACFQALAAAIDGPDRRGIVAGGPA